MFTLTQLFLKISFDFKYLSYVVANTLTLKIN